MDFLLTARAAAPSSFAVSYDVARRSSFGLMNQTQVKNSLHLKNNRPLEEILGGRTSQSIMVAKNNNHSIQI
jgi:hypothetical protein